MTDVNGGAMAGRAFLVVKGLSDVLIRCEAPLTTLIKDTYPTGFEQQNPPIVYFSSKTLNTAIDKRHYPTYSIDRVIKLDNKIIIAL
jgi:hypothetical protein